MTKDHHRRTRGLTVIAGCALALFAGTVALEGPGPMRNGVILGLACSLVNALAGFAAVHWAFKRSNRLFYGAYFGSMLWKILVLGGVFFLVRGHAAFHPAGALVSLAAATFLLNALELGYLPEGSSAVRP